MFISFQYELRTPLTLIPGPLDDYWERTGVDGGSRKLSKLIQKHARCL